MYLRNLGKHFHERLLRTKGVEISTDQMQMI